MGTRTSGSSPRARRIIQHLYRLLPGSAAQHVYAAAALFVLLAALSLQAPPYATAASGTTSTAVTARTLRADFPALQSAHLTSAVVHLQTAPRRAFDARSDSARDLKPQLDAAAAARTYRDRDAFGAHPSSVARLRAVVTVSGASSLPPPA